MIGRLDIALTQLLLESLPSLLGGPTPPVQLSILSDVFVMDPNQPTQKRESHGPTINATCLLSIRATRPARTDCSSRLWPGHAAFAS